MTETKTKTIEQAGKINVPYLNAYASITKALERIKTASTPGRFTQDFLATKLGMKGGSAKPIIPFLKRTGFLNGDGTPTNLYREFRNDSLRPAAAAQAVRNGYKALYEINEYAHDLKDVELKGVVVQATGLDATSSTVRAIVGSFKALRSFADFDAARAIEDASETLDSEPKVVDQSQKAPAKVRPADLRLGYTINLNLPATSDVAVFNAIFKSLREHLLD